MEKLVKKAKKGDAGAFIALMEQNRQSMIRIAFAYLGNEEDVADAMQETILSAFEKLDTLRRAEYFRTWLIRILINQCIAMRRHRSRTVPMNEAEEASQFYDFSTDLEFNDLLKTGGQPADLPDVLWGTVFHRRDRTAAPYERKYGEE